MGGIGVAHADGRMGMSTLSRLCLFDIEVTDDKAWCWSSVTGWV